MVRSLVGIIAGVVFASAVILGVSGLSEPLVDVVQPFVVKISQAVPVDVEMLVHMEDGQAITVTTPITVGVDLQVQVQGLNSLVVASRTSEPARVFVEPISAGEEDEDNLGIPFTLIVDSEDIALIELTAYKDPNERFNLSGVIQQAKDSDPISDIPTTIRFYDKEGELVGVDSIINVSYGLKPGGVNRFSYTAMLGPNEIGSYRLEFKAVR
jgi:hypothetical protein